MKISALIPDSKNANRGTKRGNIATQTSLSRFGAARSIVVDRDNRIIAGNHVVANAPASGIDDAIVVESDGSKLVVVKRTDLSLDDPKARELAIADNRAGELGLEWDATVMADLCGDLDLKPFFTDMELADLLPALVGGIIGDEDDAPETPTETTTQLGDLYILGDHRLLCGNSTNVDEVERLLDGIQPQMLFTDIPYNAAFNGRSGDFDVIKNDNLSTHDFEQFVDGFASVLHTLNIPETYQCCDWRLYPKLYRTFGCKALIVWAKNVFGMGRGYRHQHELIVYNGSFDSTTESDLWQIAKEPSKYVHPTQKPVELPTRAILNSSRAGDAVLDLFGGSGSTLIACEKSKRACYMMELDPKYCDVIVARWERATGKKAVLNGRTQTNSDSSEAA